MIRNEFIWFVWWWSYHPKKKWRKICIMRYAQCCSFLSLFSGDAPPPNKQKKYIHSLIIHYCICKLQDWTKFNSVEVNVISTLCTPGNKMVWIFRWHHFLMMTFITIRSQNFPIFRCLPGVFSLRPNQFGIKRPNYWPSVTCALSSLYSDQPILNKVQVFKFIIPIYCRGNKLCWFLDLPVNNDKINL
jgi:hypothetical protein